MAAINFGTIPAELKACPHWVLWKYETDKNDKITKVPYQKNGSNKASTINPKTWCSFDDAKKALDFHVADGIGFVFTRDSFSGVDLDHCRDSSTGAIDAWALKYLKILKSYTEISPSGEGLHVIVKGDIPEGRTGGKKNLVGPDYRPNAAIEIYSEGRFFTVTGNSPFLDSTDISNTVQDFQDELRALYIELFGTEEPKGKGKGNSTTTSPTSSSPSSDDDAVIKRMLLSANHEKIKLLWEGSWIGYPSQSEADLGFCNHLAFSCRKDPLQMDRIFRQSKLMRPKWDEKHGKQTYGDKTIQEAIAGTTEVYKPPIDTEEIINFFSEDIHAKALEILEHGDPIQYIVNSCGRMVLGAEKAFRKMVCCMGAQNVRQSSGLHPKFSAESGMGKTWIILTFAHHLPPEAVVKGSSSNMAVFYHPDGNKVLRILDDYVAGNETMDTIIKQTTSVYHQKYEHKTVKKQEAATLFVGSEQTWAITSIDGSQDIQVLNRGLPINLDDSEELTKRVNALIIERYGKGEEQFIEDEMVQICREIWRILRGEIDELINVKVPFWERVEWLENSNRRNASLFMDVLVTQTAMNMLQREIDKDGYYLATENDFKAAREIFVEKTDAEEMVKRLTKVEREICDLLDANNPSGMTLKQMSAKLGLTPQRIGQIISGRKDRGGGGLMQKVQLFEDRISKTIKIDEDERRTEWSTIFTIQGYNHFEGFEAMVRLKPFQPLKPDETMDETKKIGDNQADETIETHI